MSDPEERSGAEHAANEDRLLLRPEDIAARLDVAAETVNAWMLSGELPFVEVTGERFVLMPAFERFVERRDTGVTIEEQAERYIGPGFEGETDRRIELYRAYEQDPERQAVARADHEELLRTGETERHGESPYDIASDLFDYARGAIADPERRQRVRAAINGVLANYQRRRDPARVLSRADFIEALRGVLAPAEFEKARARLLAQPHPAADMFSAEDEGKTGE